MECPRCRTPNAEDARFCEQCGARLELACPSCGAPAGAGKKFCRFCGAGLTTESDSATSPRTYTPKHLAEKILTSKTALEGERKQVTVLFADLKGSMELLAERDPEDARRLIDPVLESMMEAVHRYEGTVNQVMGDGIMALFGAPIAHEDHAVRACYAALRMQETVKRYAETAWRTEGVAIQIRVGLNSGEVVVRSIGSDLHMDYSAVGQTTHLAARTEQLAAPGSTLITGDTLRLVEGYVEVKPLGAVNVKGLSAPIEVYEILGPGAVRSRLQAAVARGLTRFVGREDKIEQLCRALDRVRKGHGEVIAVVGEPGVGKSRLILEFTHPERTLGWLIVESRSVSYGKAAPYLPVIELLKAYFKVQDRDDERQIREKITSRVLTLDRALEPIVPALLELLDVPIGDSQWQALDPAQRRQRTLEAVKRLLLRESHVQPLLLIFEDLHWIDAETQALLDGLVESLPTTRILLLVNYRPEYQHGWSNKTYYTQLRIDPLPAESADELLDTLLGKDATLRPLKRMLVEQTEGNPFFLEESVRTLVETHVLTGEREAYRLARAVETIQVPTTVEAVLAARIDRLPPQEKRLLHSAAVIGKDVPFALLKAISDQSDDELRQSLGHLQVAEFLYETRLFPDLEYTFKHSLTHEVAYRALLQAQRRALHARVVKAIEELHPSRTAEDLTRLAHHAFRGEMWDKAVAFSREAGTRAVARSASHEAVASFEQALAALRHLPESRETVARAIDLRLDLQSAFVPLGELERMLGYLREAETLAATLGDQHRLGRVSAYMSHCLWWMGEAERSAESGQRALTIAKTLGDFRLEMLSNLRLGQAYFALGQYHRAIDVCQWIIEALKGDLIREGFGLPAIPSVVSRLFMGRSLGNLGEFGPGIATTDEAIQIAEQARHPYSVVLAYWGSAEVHLTQGNLVKAIAALEHARGLCEGGDFVLMFPMVARTLGHAYVFSGRLADGLSLLQQAIEQYTAMNYMTALIPTSGTLSEGLLLAGRLADALQAAPRARELCRTHRQRGYEVRALQVLADTYAAQNPPDVPAADAAYHEGLALAEELGMRPQTARCHLGLGRLHAKIRRYDQAQKHLATAATMFREMGMKLWLEEAEAELSAL